MTAVCAALTSIRVRVRQDQSNLVYCSTRASPMRQRGAGTTGTAQGHQAAIETQHAIRNGGRWRLGFSAVLRSARSRNACRRRRSRLLRAFRRSKSPSLRCKNLRVCLSLRVCRQHTRLSRFAIRSFIERLAIRRDSRLSQLCLPPPPLLRRLCARAARAEPPGCSSAAS